MQKIILPGVITVYNPNLEKQLDEIEEYGLSQVALFLSGANFTDRQKYFRRLEKIKHLTIPFVHARSDMKPTEFEYLSKRFNTKNFNLHPETEFPPKYNLDNFKDRIYIENSSRFEPEDLPGYAGICLDFSHLEEWRFSDREKYQKIRSLVELHHVGVSHVSAIRPHPVFNEEGRLSRDNHTMTDIHEFDYLKKYPAKFFGEYIAIELTNPLIEQLELIEYLKYLLKGCL